MTLSGQLLLLGLPCLTPFALYAQSVGPSAIDAVGSSAVSGGNTYEYAIGQTVAGPTYSSPSLIVTPGVLQPNFDATGVHPAVITAADLHIYPSPVEHTLFLEPAFNGSGVLQYSLYDAAGKLVMSREASLSSGRERQALEVAPLAAGEYLLQVQWRQAGSAFSAGYKVQKLR